MVALNQRTGRDSHNMPPWLATFLFAVTLGLFELFRNLHQMEYISFHGEDGMSTLLDQPLVTSNRNNTAKTTIAYAVSITHFEVDQNKNEPHNVFDRAAVLHQSIKVAMMKSPRYDYHIYAFVHPDAVGAKPLLQRLGYRVQIRDTPFNISKVSNPELVEAQGNGCCSEREYLKLYSYLLSDYPVAVHMDLDTIVLRSMDDVFDMMMLKTGEGPSTSQQSELFSRKSTMWTSNPQNNIKSTHSSKRVLENPENINFMFTRDYNMVDPSDPPYKQPYQIGVQGGFLVIRPNQRDFDRMIEIILSGGEEYTIGDGWGGSKLGYGGYYGAATIQGLASFYYDYHEKAQRSIELNKCRYNTMVDNPYFFDKGSNKTLCRTLESECEDCRKTKLEDVYSAHFTVCGKPEWCDTLDPDKDRLCSQLMKKWHQTRLSLELEWMNRFSSSKNGNDKANLMYVPQLNGVDPSESRGKLLESNKLGHCDGENYIPLQYPAMATTSLHSDEAPLI